MFKFFRSKPKKINSNFLFIIGTGRSGTHFLGRVIGNHPEVQVLMENRKTFSLVKKAAITKRTNKDLDKLITRYQKIQENSNKGFILEKSHPNIWLVPRLNESFSSSHFIGVQRDVYQVVYSMLRHKGVSKWYKKLPQDKLSDFLGITKQNRAYFHSLPIEAKCTIRWMAHKSKLLELKKTYPKKIVIIDYQELCNNFEEQVARLESITGLDLINYAEKPKEESLNKYKNLNQSQIDIINETLQKEAGNF